MMFDAALCGDVSSCRLTFNLKAMKLIYTIFHKNKVYKTIQAEIVEI